MINRDREVFEALRDDPELLAIADAVVETQKLSRPFGLRGSLVGIAVAAAALLLIVWLVR
jgi:hypothetical protein